PAGSRLARVATPGPEDGRGAAPLLPIAHAPARTAARPRCTHFAPDRDADREACTSATLAEGANPYRPRARSAWACEDCTSDGIRDQPVGGRRRPGGTSPQPPAPYRRRGARRPARPRKESRG